MNLAEDKRESDGLCIRPCLLQVTEELHGCLKLAGAPPPSVGAIENAVMNRFGAYGRWFDQDVRSW